MKHSDLEPGQQQQPLGPATPQPAPAQPEWVPHAPGVERSTQTGWLRTVAVTPPPWRQRALDFGDV